MHPDTLQLLGYVAIALQCLIVGLLIWRKRFGCFSPKDRQEFAQEVIRELYRQRQQGQYEALEELRHQSHLRSDSNDPEPYGENIA